MVTPEIKSTLPQPAQVDTNDIGPPLPLGSEPWAHLLLRWMLKLPLGPMIADLTIEEVRYLKYMIEDMGESRNLWLEERGLTDFEARGLDWEGQVLPLLKRRLNPPLRTWSEGNNIFAEAKARTDICEFASEFTTLRPAGAKMRGLCPLHEEKTGSFYINPERQTWWCFGACGRGGDVIELGRLLREVGRLW